MFRQLCKIAILAKLVYDEISFLSCFHLLHKFCRYVPVVKNITIEKKIALVIRTYFDVTKIAIQQIAKHLNTTLDSVQLCRAVKLFNAEEAAGPGPKFSSRKRAA